MSIATKKAYALIRCNILDGTFKAGSHLKEEELVKLTQVSRTPVRDALRHLAADHFVITKPNQGVFVNTWSAGDIEDIFDLRAILEALAAKKAAANIDGETLTRLRTDYDAIQAMLDNGTVDMDAFLTSNNDFHTRIIAAANSPTLTKSLAALVQPPVVAKTAASYTLADLQNSNDHHRELLDALTAGDGDWAQATMQTHIKAAKRKFFAAYSGD